MTHSQASIFGLPEFLCMDYPPWKREEMKSMECGMKGLNLTRAEDSYGAEVPGSGAGTRPGRVQPPGAQPLL